MYHISKINGEHSMDLKTVINGIEFKKSSISGRDHLCVGVSINQSSVIVINLKAPDKMLEFTHKEWDAFVSGVKLGEFEVSP
jgi:hypothetical protein